MVFLFPPGDVIKSCTRDWLVHSESTALVVLLQCKLTCGVRPLRQLSIGSVAHKVLLIFALWKLGAPELLQAPSPLPMLWIAAPTLVDEAGDEPDCGAGSRSSVEASSPGPGRYNPGLLLDKFSLSFSSCFLTNSFFLGIGMDDGVGGEVGVLNATDDEDESCLTYSLARTRGAGHSPASRMMMVPSSLGEEEDEELPQAVIEALVSTWP